MLQHSVSQSSADSNGENQPYTRDVERDAARRLATLVECLPGIAYRCSNDSNWTTTLIEGEVAGITGYASEMFVSGEVQLGQLIHPDDRKQVWNGVQEALREHSRFQLRYRLHHRDGTIRWIWEQGGGVYGDDGELLFLEGYLSDVTETVALRHQLLEKEQLAAIGTAAAMFAHEVANPLNSIQLGVDCLGELDAARENERATCLDICRAEIERLQCLITDFRTLSRRNRLRLEEVNLPDLVAEIFSSRMRTWRTEKITVESSFAATLPAVRGDQGKLMQALTNLCKNAVEAMPDGGTLRLEAERKGERVELRITDTGKGIADGVDVFELFETTKPEGSGLGLSIVREIVLSHEGEIHFDSELGRGTTFTLSLPVSDMA